MHLDQDIVFLHIRLRHIGGPQAFLFPIAVNDKSFHGISFFEEVQETNPPDWDVWEFGMMVIILLGKKTSP